MKTSSVAQSAFMLALTAGTGSAARHRISIKHFGVKFRIDWWDDNRAQPYRISFTKRGTYSTYTFDPFGALNIITVGDEQFDYRSSSLEASDEASDSTSDVRSRKLLAMPEDLEADEMELEQDHHSRRLYDCSDCENTWDTLCDVGLPAVCAEVDDLTGDAYTTVALMCNKFGKECGAASADEFCEDVCTEDIPEECDPNPCENEGECSADAGGGHVCSCASGYGGMTCQTETSSLDSFYIEVEYIGTWTDARQAVFQTAADRWTEVITHVPCGGNSDYPAGRVLITATLEYIDGVGGTLGSAGRRIYWTSCPTITATGAMTFDIDDIADMEEDDIFEGVILHEMGHVIGVGSSAFAEECSTCSTDEDPAWLCPAALSAYYDLGGSDADILELDGGSGTSCGHLDETIFDDELMTGYVDSTMYLSKMTAALLDDLEYIVDPSAVDSYTLPSERVVSISAEDGPSIFINDTAVPVMIHSMNDDGTLVEVEDIVMVF